MLVVVGLAGLVRAQEGHFQPGRLAVLRAGDGRLDLNRRQSAVFVDEFTTNDLAQAAAFSVRIPTNGANSFFFNGHAGTEGTLTRSMNGRLLAFAGYGGVDLLQVNGTASRLDIQRGYATLDAAGQLHTYLYHSKMTDAKLIPRGVATDGTNHFWGGGNTFGTFYHEPGASNDPVRFTAFPNSRSVRIIEGALYANMNAADGFLIDQPAGIYAFEPLALPRATNTLAKLVLQTAPEYAKAAAFDINPAGNLAYVADTAEGIQKYVKTNGAWKLAYNLTIPQNIPKKLNTGAGCFGLAVDFRGATPLLFATTTEGYGGSVNSNRVVRILDTGATAQVATLAQAGSTNIAYRGIAFTPQ